MMQEVFDRGSYELSLSAVPLLLISMLCLLLSARTLFTEGFKRISFALFLLTSAVSIWLGSFFWMYSSVNERVAMWWAKASYLGVPFISSTLYYFTVLAIRKYDTKKGLVRMGFALSLLTSVVVIGTDTVISGVRHFSWGYYPQYTLWSIVYLVFVFGFIGLSIHQLWMEYHQSAPESTDRRRIRAFLAAFTIASVGGVDYLAKFGLPVYPFGYLAIFTGVLIMERTLSLYRLIDITPRFAAESIINTMNESLMVLDAEGVIRLVNHSSASLLGIPEKELLGKHITTIVGDSICSDLSMFDRNGALRIHELSYTHPNGGRLIISLSASAMKDEQGQLLAVVCVIRDITELRRAESELRSAHDALERKVNERTAELAYANEKLQKENAERKLLEESLRETAQRLQLATASGQLGIWDWDIYTGALVWDDRMSELYGVTSDSFRGRVEDWQDSVHREDRVRAMEAVDAAVRGEKAYDVEFRIVRLDGAVRLIKANGIVIRDAERKATRMIGLNYDITERRRLEQESMKVEKLESIGIFAGGMAHDFNNLLQVIIANVFLARMRLDPGSKAYGCLTNAEKAAEQARELGHLLLTFSKAGEPFKQITHIENLIKESVGLTLSGTNIVSEFEFQDALYPVEIDEEQIKQVFNSLINNAKEAMPDGGILRIKANNVELSERTGLPVKEGKYLLISIEDQGVGIPEINLRRIFDPYFTTKEMGADKGTGLGLAICHSIIKRHRGFITVASKVGVGSTFHVYIPAAEE